jgi:hypothetical protein
MKEKGEVNFGPIETEPSPVRWALRCRRSIISGFLGIRRSGLRTQPGNKKGNESGCDRDPEGRI